MATKFYKCNHCGNVIEKHVDSKVPVVCCGEKMQELVANTVDASTEKHVPVVTKVDDCTIKVQVGSVEHPMLPEHHISFIYVETENEDQLERQTGGYILHMFRQTCSSLRVLQLARSVEDRAIKRYWYIVKFNIKDSFRGPFFCG